MGAGISALLYSHDLIALEVLARKVQSFLQAGGKLGAPVAVVVQEVEAHANTPRDFLLAMAC